MHESGLDSKGKNGGKIARKRIARGERETDRQREREREREREKYTKQRLCNAWHKSHSSLNKTQMVVLSILWKIKGAFCLFDFYKAIISIALISDYMMKWNETFTVKKRRGKKKKRKRKKERKKEIEKGEPTKVWWTTEKRPRIFLFLKPRLFLLFFFLWKDNIASGNTKACMQMKPSLKKKRGKKEKEKERKKKQREKWWRWTVKHGMNEWWEWK